MTDKALQVMHTDIVEKRFSEEQIELIKRTVCKGASNDELAMFLHIAQKSGLDPFAKQIYAIKRKDFKSGMEVMTIQTSIDGYRLIAERTGKYAPGKAPEYAYKTDGSLKSATVTINKRVGDQWFEVQATAFYDEYVQRFGDKIANMWQKMPHVMLAKCAESLALRRAFPNETLGILTADEMEQSTNESPMRTVRMPEPKTYAISPPPVSAIDDQVRGEPIVSDRDKLLENSLREPSEGHRNPLTEITPSTAEEMPSENLLKHFRATVRETKLGDRVKAWCMAAWGKSSSKDLTAKQIQQVLQLIQNGAIRADTGQ